MIIYGGREIGGVESWGEMAARRLGVRRAFDRFRARRQPDLSMRTGMVGLNYQVGPGGTSRQNWPGGKAIGSQPSAYGERSRTAFSRSKSGDTRAEAGFLSRCAWRAPAALVRDQFAGPFLA